MAVLQTRDIGNLVRALGEELTERGDQSDTINLGA